jgi:hypothetical protein
LKISPFVVSGVTKFSQNANHVGNMHEPLTNICTTNTTLSVTFLCQTNQRCQ